MTDDKNKLSERELEVLRLVATGASNKEIAQKLVISTNTVKVHLRNIYSKIGVNSRTEAAMYAVNSGLIPGGSPAENISSDLAELSESGVQSGSLGDSSTQGRGALFRGNLIWIVLGVVIIVTISFGWLFVNSLQSENESFSGTQPVAEEQRWEVLAPMTIQRSFIALVTSDGFIYAIGGDSGKGVSDTIERYDPESNTWETFTNKPTAVSDVNAISIGGKLYIPGGILASGEVTDVLEIYDPVVDTWQGGARIPEKVSGYTSVAYEGKLYLFGGWDGENQLSSVYVYDPESDTWQPKTPLPVARSQAGAAVAGGNIYILGGFDGVEGLATVDIYVPGLDDGINNPWIVGNPMPEVRYGMGITSVAEMIYLIGGQNNTNGLLPSYLYVPRTDEWQPIQEPISEMWYGLRLTPLGTKIYAIGGEIQQMPSDMNMSFKAIYLTLIPIVP